MKEPVKRKRVEGGRARRLGLPVKAAESFEEDQEKREREGREDNEKRARKEQRAKDRFRASWEKGRIAFGLNAFRHAPGEVAEDRDTIELVRAHGVAFDEDGIKTLLGRLTEDDFMLHEAEDGGIAFSYRLGSSKGTVYDIAGYMQTGSIFRVVHIGPAQG